MARQHLWGDLPPAAATKIGPRPNQNTDPSDRGAGECEECSVGLQCNGMDDVVVLPGYAALGQDRFLRAGDSAWMSRVGLNPQESMPHPAARAHACRQRDGGLRRWAMRGHAAAAARPSRIRSALEAPLAHGLSYGQSCLERFAQDALGSSMAQGAEKGLGVEGVPFVCVCEPLEQIAALCWEWDLFDGDLPRCSERKPVATIAEPLVEARRTW